MSRMQKCGLWQLPRLSSAFNSFKFTNVFWIIIHYLWQFILLLFSQEYFLLIYRHSGQNVHNSSVKLPVPIYNWWNCEFIRSLQLFDLAKFNILCDLMKLNNLIRPVNVQLLKLNQSLWFDQCMFNFWNWINPYDWLMLLLWEIVFKRSWMSRCLTN